MSLKIIVTSFFIVVFSYGCSYKNINIKESTEYSSLKNKEDNVGLYNYKRFLVQDVDSSSPDANSFSFSETQYLVSSGEHDVSIIIDFNREIPVMVGNETLQEIGPYLAYARIKMNFSPGKEFCINGHIYPVERVVGVWFEECLNEQKVSKEIKVSFRQVSVGEIIQGSAYFQYAPVK